jgi:hypothetical protein
MEEIVNKVAQSSLMVFDLEDYYPDNNHIAMIDVSEWLFGGFILREDEFRNKLKETDWSVFQDKYVGLYCSEDAVLPAWTYALVAVHVAPFALRVIHGNKNQVIIAWYEDVLQKIDYAEYTEKPIILKGCSKKEVPNEVYTIVIQKLTKVARSIMFGEACSAVPLFKKKK